MKITVIFLFCVVCGICLGGIAAVMMVQTIQTAAFYAGSLLGAVAALVCSPFFIIKRSHPEIFSAMVISFVLSAPVALLTGMAGSPRLGLGLTIFSIFSVNYLLLIRKSNDKNQDPFARRDILVVPLICLVVAGGLAYTQDPLPDDAALLTRMMGDNDMQVSYMAATKLMRYGKEPLLEALLNNDSRVRSTAARFLGYLGDPAAQNALIKVSEDSDSHVRMWAAFSLGTIGDSRALDTLTRLANDQEAIVRDEAIRAIEKLRAKGIQQPGK